MKMGTMLIVIGLLALAVFGCINANQGNGQPDCSKCNTGCPICDKNGPDVNIAPITVGAGISMIAPSSCTDELCGFSKVKSYADELGLGFKSFKADWVPQPVVLVYTEDTAYVFQSDSSVRREFMKGMCDFTNSTKACGIAKQETENAKTEIKSCLQNYSVSLDTVTFYHASWCPHCQKMEPWVAELEKQGYKFLWAQDDDPDNTNVTIAKKCLSSVLQFGQGIPQFGCPANNELHVGEFMSKEDMLKFSQDCLAASK